MTPQSNLRTITPAWAAKVLKYKNVGNRPINEKHVKELADEMAGGRWELNGDTICLNGERLIDGQHRLKAVILSGVSIRTFVVDGLKSETFHTKDIGKRRSGSDTFAAAGEQNTTRLAAALAMVETYMAGKAGYKMSYTNGQLQDLLDKYPDIRETCAKSFKCQGFVNRSILDSCHYLFSKKDPELADVFITATLKGVGLEAGSPWLALRERLVSNSINKAKLDKWHLMALCIKAWNSARKGKPLHQLKWTPDGKNAENFPIIL